MLVDIAMGIVCVGWVVFASHGWPYGFGILAVFLALAAIASKLTKSYERTGLAVRIRESLLLGSPREHHRQSAHYESRFLFS